MTSEFFDKNFKRDFLTKTKILQKYYLIYSSFTLFSPAADLSLRPNTEKCT